jgi:hypothetical protein
MTLPGAETIKGGIIGVDCFLRSAGLPLTSETAGTDMLSSDCVGEVSGDCSGVWVECVVVAECLTEDDMSNEQYRADERERTRQVKSSLAKDAVRCHVEVRRRDEREAGGVKGVVRRRCSPGASSVEWRGSLWQRRSRELN